MNEDCWTLTEVIEFFEVREDFLLELEEEEILCPVAAEDRAGRVFPPAELEKLRLAKLLVEEMGVNLSGVDVILRMRADMIALRRQFDAILEDLARHLKEVTGRER